MYLSPCIEILHETGDRKSILISQERIILIVKLPTGLCFPEEVIKDKLFGNQIYFSNNFYLQHRIYACCFGQGSIYIPTKQQQKTCPYVAPIIHGVMWNGLRMKNLLLNHSVN